jgi:hypothetical protein
MTVSDETQKLWAFVNSFAEWFSALATIGAVVGALYLARRDDLKLRVSAGLRIIVVGPPGAPRPEVVHVTVVNVGRRPAQVETLNWRIGRFRRSWFFWMRPVEFNSSALPIRLEEGQRATYSMAAERTPEIFEPLARDVTRSWVRRRFAPVYVLANTSTGQTFAQQVERDLRTRIVGLPPGP